MLVDHEADPGEQASTQWEEILVEFLLPPKVR